MRTPLLRIALLCSLLPWTAGGSSAVPPAPPSRSPEYAAVQQRLARGWNTWDTHSVTAQVLLPEAFTVRVGLKHNTALNADTFLADALIGRHDPQAEQVTPGPHTWDGTYTELQLSWRGHVARVQSAHDGDDLVLLVTPLGSKAPLPATVVFSTGILWNRAGSVARVGNHIEFTQQSRRVPVYCTAGDTVRREIVTGPLATPYFAATLSEPIGISTGRTRSVADIQKILEAARPKTTDVRTAIQTVLGWNSIYEPTHDRVVSPVSRIWNLNWGGYVLFDWDTFFAAAMAATGHRDLAYANAIEIIREATAEGFVPNYGRTDGWKSVDRSQPPVGSPTLLRLYRQFGEQWILRDTFDALLRWNRWFPQHRDVDGYLVWASDRDTPPPSPDDGSVGTKQGAMYESGLDNSPMFDEAPFDPKTQKLLQADVGLMGFYVADCNALAEIADLLDRGTEARELRDRGARYAARLQTLWDNERGIYLNKNLQTGAFNPRLSPTNFYPLLGRVPSAEQARRMIAGHLLNPAEFGGEWMLPSIARNDPAFKDQEYWRGRVWAPMNYLVYLGLLNYDEPAARRQLAERSLALFQKEWLAKGHVHENYNAITGEGDDVSSSDRFYHWGALLALISVMEEEAESGKP